MALQFDLPIKIFVKSTMKVMAPRRLHPNARKGFFISDAWDPEFRFLEKSRLALRRRLFLATPGPGQTVRFCRIPSTSLDSIRLRQR
jgi:hypothetical protein